MSDELTLQRAHAAQRSRWAMLALALGSGALLIAGGGMALRAVAADWGGATPPAPLAPGTLNQLPLRIGPWSGEDVPIDAHLRAATGAEELLNRQYVRGADSVSFYVSYGVRARDLAPHRPEVCYPGAGWTLVSATRAETAMPDGPLPYRALRFARGGLSDLELIVLNYYIVDGVYAADFEYVRDRLRAARHVVQVQLACATTPYRDHGAAQDAAESLLREAAPQLRAVLLAASQCGSEP